MVKTEIKQNTKECRSCLKCIEECPAKAIKVNPLNITIEKTLCITCGHCVFACQAKENIEKSEYSEFTRFLNFIKKSKNIFVS